MNVYCSKCGRFIGSSSDEFKMRSQRFFGLSAADHKSLLCEDCWKLEDSSNKEESSKKEVSPMYLEYVEGENILHTELEDIQF